MDTTKTISYRGYVLNDPGIPAALRPDNSITGSVIDTWDMSNVDVVQFLEKRAQGDGMDAGEVFLGARRIDVSGTLYGSSRAALYDSLRALMAALNPVLAARESPGDKGYMPLYFSAPTTDVVNFPTGSIDLLVNAIPRVRRYVTQRDQLGGESTDALALPWAATFYAKDPGVYGATSKDYVVTGTVSGNLTNRGSYLTPLDCLFVVGSGAGTISITAGGTTIKITVPASTGDRIIRYNGQERILTAEESDLELPRFDWLDLGAQQAHPLVPPGVSPYSITFTGITPKVGSVSHIWFDESYAL